MDAWLTIVLAVLLAARLTRLITLDTITAPIRDRLPGLLGALVQCAWCTGVWVAVPVGLSWYWWSDQPWWQVTALIGATAWVSGAVSTAAMPGQHEVVTVGPVALVNADAPIAPVEAELETCSVEPEIEAAVERAVAKALAEAFGDGEQDGGS